MTNNSISSRISENSMSSSSSSQSFSSNASSSHDNHKHAKQKSHHSEPNDFNNDLYQDLVQTAKTITQTEPLLAPYLQSTILHPQNKSLECIIARTLSNRLLQSQMPSTMNVEALTQMFIETMQSTDLEHGHTMMEAIRMDLKACLKRDPACESCLEIVLYFKGFASLVCHRAAKRKWMKTVNVQQSQSNTRTNTHTRTNTNTRYVSLWLQSQASATFGVDIHPGATIGAGVMFDHGTGIVIGETATIGDNCTFLHGVTLGGTGKASGDRHPKVGKNVLIGAGATVLGNIKIGQGCKIGAGSVVLKPIPHGATAVGAPAKIIGFAKEHKPGSLVDSGFQNVVPIGGLMDNTSTHGPDSGKPGHGHGHGGDSANRTASTVSSLSANEDSEKSKKKKSFTRRWKMCRRSRTPSTKGSGSESESKSQPSSQRRASVEKNICVFRSFCSEKEMGRCGGVSYACLHEKLKAHCTEDEIGEVYMTLLKRNPELGYVPRKVFEKEFPTIAHKYTHLDMKQCDDIIKLR